MTGRFLKSFLHPVCIIGLLLFFVGLGASVVALVADLFHAEARPYQGLLTFVLYPGVMMFGFGVLLLGRWLERRRSRALEDSHEAWRPALNWRDRRHRRIVFGLATFSSLFLLSSVVGAWRAYEFTESEAFCGALCHEPMEPQFVAHADSPHANIPCTECHVGPGLRGYMQAKISGINQLVQMLGHSWPEPIRAHREKVPGASDTCEHCHWDTHFSGERFDNRARYSYDLPNSRRFLRILFNRSPAGTGNGGRINGHWHEGLEIEFRAADHLQQHLPWVRVRYEDGSERIYTEQPKPPPKRPEGAPAGESAGADAIASPATTHGSESADPHSGEPVDVESLATEKMDCLTCHNRPAHRFRTPGHAVDLAIEAGWIDGTLPFAKKASVAALAADVDGQDGLTRDEGAAAAREGVLRFYRESFPELARDRSSTVQATADAVAKLYRRDVFPNMKINGFTHPDNIGHREFPGCFRCHSGRHVDSTGQAIPNDCGLCHDFFERERATGTLTAIPADLSSIHPFGPETHRDVDCWTCHSGKISPYDACASCHEHAAKAHGMRFECSICHKPQAETVVNTTCAPCHPTGASQLHQIAEHGDCKGCHTPHEWTVADAKCTPCHETVEGKPLAEHHPGKACGPCHEFTGVQAHMMGLRIGD